MKRLAVPLLVVWMWLLLGAPSAHTTHGSRLATELVKREGDPAAPEPGALALIGSGLTGIALWIRRRRRG